MSEAAESTFPARDELVGRYSQIWQVAHTEAVERLGGAPENGYHPSRAVAELMWIAGVLVGRELRATADHAQQIDASSTLRLGDITELRMVGYHINI